MPTDTSFDALRDPSASARPVCVALDGTLVATQLFSERVALLFRQRPGWRWRCRSGCSAAALGLKRRVAQSSKLDAAFLPYRRPLIASLQACRDERSQGRARRRRRCRTGGTRRQSPGLVRRRVRQRSCAARRGHLRVAGGGLSAGLRLHRPLRRGSARARRRDARLLGRRGARRRLRARRLEASAGAFAPAQHLARA